jgi:tripartite-type tricarboxylate transporter receptor subunit TctC
MLVRFLAIIAALLPALAAAQACPEKTLYYWRAFPAGGESDISARMGLGAK